MILVTANTKEFGVSKSSVGGLDENPCQVELTAATGFPYTLTSSYPRAQFLSRFLYPDREAGKE